MAGAGGVTVGVLPELACNVAVGAVLRTGTVTLVAGVVAQAAVHEQISLVMGAVGAACIAVVDIGVEIFCVRGALSLHVVKIGNAN